MSEYKKIKGGYHGKLLRVDLSSLSYKIEDLDENLLLDYIGGRGLGVKLLYDETAAGIDPLGPENKLYFLTGPSQGTNIPTHSRFEVVAKSPLTGTAAGSSSGGHFGLQFKGTGFDVVVFEGKANKPVYVYIEEGNVTIHDASHLWGQLVPAACDKLIEETNAKAAIACIGPAGENLSPIASIMNDKHHSVGRSGLGAVMGSKNLKALVCKGSVETPIGDKEKFDAANKNWRRFIGEAPLTKDVLKEYGTLALVKVINHYGAFPTNNFQDGYFVDIDSISGETFREFNFVKSEPCRGCPISCVHMSRTPSRDGKGPEFETLWAFGALSGIKDLDEITNANYNCNDMGIDTISAGSTIACAMELSEKGFLDEETMKMIRAELGHDLKFGDTKAIVLYSRLIGTMEGFGKYLAMGSARMAAHFGHPELAMHVKGLELPAYDPRGFHGMAISLATNNRGGCHLRAYMVGPEALGTPVLIDRFTAAGKPGLTILYQNLTATIDSMCNCVFTNFALNPDLYAEMLAGITGREIDGNELLKMGERIWNIEKMYNVREGLTREDDTLPKRLLEEPFKCGHSKDHKIELEPMLDEYYSLRGWSKEGIPSESKLKELGLK